MNTPALRLVGLVGLLGWAFAASLHADPTPAPPASEGKSTVFSKDFADSTPGPVGDNPNIVVWTGDPKGSWGEASIVAPPSSLSDSPKAALLLTSNAATPKTFAPSVTVKTPSFLTGVKTKGTYKIRFVIPVEGPYRADFFFGGSWDANATILILQNGNITAMQKTGTEYKPLPLGEYKANKWQELKLVFDGEKKTYSIFLGEQQLANEIPWNTPGLTSLDTLVLATGFEPKETGIPLFYLQQIEVTQE